ncbi:flavoprotein [Streptomyces sp. SID13031]|uniref:flavoprotein n=1 Tax=Streptomyces sp. SID13031 TaxID=2706046 RepID=UPI0013C70F26|nr:flavoprotein [Streptomyces sp. SID13031]
MTNRTLYIVVCGAPLASRTADGVQAARANGWDPYVIPTDAAAPWLVDQLDGAPVITGNRTPDQPKRTPPADAVAVVPMTFNTLNAWANGNAYSYPLTTLCASLGARIPTITVPFAKHDLAGHPAWLASLAVLRYAGIKVLDPHDGSTSKVEPVASGTGDQLSAQFRWEWIFANLDRGQEA